jgi:hypothetical protein
MTQDSKNFPATKSNYRSWMSTRMHELKRKAPFARFGWRVSTLI